MEILDTRKTYFLHNCQFCSIITKRSIHIDKIQGVGHLRMNPNRLYYTSENESMIFVIVNDPDHLDQEDRVDMDDGGEEIEDYQN